MSSLGMPVRVHVEELRRASTGAPGSAGPEQLTLDPAPLPWTAITAISAVGGLLLLLNVLLIVFFVRRRRRSTKHGTVDSACEFSNHYRPVRLEGIDECDD